MRLLNTVTLRVENVPPDNTPSYAILSHRWTDEEVSLQDMATETGRLKAGFAKITLCCAVARHHGLNYVWIDTCCIDKTSSTELSEAINSMFQWYQDAEVCYAYLYDTTSTSVTLKSEWFDRGWTLQELIAPKDVRFYASDWTLLGDRTALSSAISARTGISQAFLRGASLSDASIAEKMSWAANRKTTRQEDMSYCLLGIFNVQMPLIYGEGGEKAFRRLQFELLKQGSDSSWLAWSVVNSQPTPGDNGSAHPLGGVMATSPASFSGCRDVVRCYLEKAALPVTVSNLGVHISLPRLNDSEDPNSMLLLDCRWRHDFTNIIAVPLAYEKGRYYRTSASTTVVREGSWSAYLKNKLDIETITLSPDPFIASPHPLKDLYYFQDLPPELAIVEVHPPEVWEPSPLHVRATADPDGVVPARVIRLRYLKEDNNTTSEQTDYILLLKAHAQATGVECQHELAVIPRGTKMPVPASLVGPWGQAIWIPDLSVSLLVQIRKKFILGADTNVVRLVVEHSPDMGLYLSGGSLPQVLNLSPNGFRQRNLIAWKSLQNRRLQRRLDRERRAVQEIEEERTLKQQWLSSQLKRVSIPVTVITFPFACFWVFNVWVAIITATMHMEHGLVALALVPISGFPFFLLLPAILSLGTGLLAGLLVVSIWTCCTDTRMREQGALYDIWTDAISELYTRYWRPFNNAEMPV